MQSLLKSIINDLREHLGYPVNLIQMLSDNPQLSNPLAKPNLCIYAGSVPQWHKLGGQSRSDCGELMGWRQSGGQWGSFRIKRPEYAQISRCDITPGWTCDISEIHGFLGSKSKLTDFMTTDEMVETNSSEMIDQITHEKLAENLAHDEIRIIHSRSTSDHFTRYSWDGRLWLFNDGGSHHTAAAKYIATRLREPVALTGNLHTYSLNADAVNSLCNDFEMFIMPKVSMEFFDAMCAFKATWFSHAMPSPYEDMQAILLPRNEERSMRVAAELSKARIPNLGTYLLDLLEKQEGRR